MGRNSKPMWSLVDGQWQEGCINHRIHLDRYEVLSPCGKQKAILYSFLPYGVDDALNVRQMLARFHDRKADIWRSASDLTTGIWGSYICWIQNRETQTSLFLTDPLQSVRLHYRRDPTGFAADPMLHSLVKKPLQWNRAFLARVAATQLGTPGETPFANVNVVRPGYALLVDGEGRMHSRRVWPQSKATSPGNLVDRCAEALKEACTRICRIHPNVFISLSGGVDSTAIAMILRAVAGKNRILTGLHFYSPGSPEFDEREFADEVAATAAIDLRYLPIDKLLPFSTLSLSVPPETINPRFTLQRLTDEINAQVAGQGVLVDGQAGDLIFNNTPCPNSVVDAYLDGGFRLASMTLKNLATLTNTGRPRIAYQALRSLASRGGHETVSAIKNLEKISLLGAEFRDFSSNFASNPLEFDPSIVKRPAAREAFQSLERMIEIQPTYSDLAFPPILSPMLTKPVVEAAFSVPNYQHFNQKFDRLVLRQAANRFGDCGPLWRRSKGALDASILKGLLVNRKRIEPLLHDGVLAQLGIVKGERVSTAYREVSAGNVVGAIALSLPVNVEIYCRAWADHGGGYSM